MAYKKKNLTAAERSEIARKANAARKNRRGGRPKGLAKNGVGGEKSASVMRSIGVREEAYRIFRAIADYIGKTMADTMDDIAQGRKAANPKIFATAKKPPSAAM